MPLACEMATSNATFGMRVGVVAAHLVAERMAFNNFSCCRSFFKERTKFTGHHMLNALCCCKNVFCICAEVLLSVSRLDLNPDDKCIFCYFCFVPCPPLLPNALSALKYKKKWALPTLFCQCARQMFRWKFNGRKRGGR